MLDTGFLILDNNIVIPNPVLRNLSIVSESQSFQPDKREKPALTKYFNMTIIE